MRVAQVDVPDAGAARLLHSLAVQPLRRRRLAGHWYFALALVPVLAAAAIVYAAWPLGLAPARRSATLAAAKPTVSFHVCFANPTWAPPDADKQATHLQADPRYRGIDLARVRPERIHTELGPFRSNSALGDFVALSGLWADAGWRSMTCSSDLRGKVELWGLAVHFDGFQSGGADLTAHVTPESQGLEIVQADLPSGAQALHFVDPSGAKLAPDVNLQVH